MSLDGQIRLALQNRLVGNVGAAKSVRIYQDGAFGLDELPLVYVEVGGWTQRLVGNGNGTGQRDFERTYDVMVSIVESTKKADFAEAVNAIGDQVQYRMADYTSIDGLQFQDLTPRSATYDAWPCEEGFQGQLALVYSADVLVSERQPDLAGGRLLNPSTSDFQPFA